MTAVEGIFVSVSPVILAVELGWYGNLFSFLEEKKRAMYIGDEKPWSKLGDYEEVHSKVVRVDCEGNGLESRIAGEDYRKAFLGPMNAPISEDTMVIFGLQIAYALDLIGKQGVSHCMCILFSCYYLHYIPFPSTYITYKYTYVYHICSEFC